LGEIVGKKRLAAILGFSERSISKWSRAGMPVHKLGGRGKENQYDTSKVVTWLLSRQTSGGDPETIAARRRIACAEAGRRELRLSREQGESVPLALVGPVWERAVGVFRNRMLGLPRRAVPRLRGLPGEVAREKLLQGLVCEALDELAVRDYSPDVAAAVKEAGFQVVDVDKEKIPRPAKRSGNGKEDKAK
jgi:phage terminase Nu1 subunit (DNA packaging protein)